MRDRELEGGGRRERGWMNEQKDGNCYTIVNL